MIDKKVGDKPVHFEISIGKNFVMFMTWSILYHVILTLIDLAEEA